MHLLRALLAAVVLATCGCSGGEPESPSSAAPSATATSPATSATASPSSSEEPPPAEPPAGGADFDQAAAMSVVGILSGDIGAREATTRAYRQAANLVAGTLLEYGYRVRRQTLSVPSGMSWGVPVPAGTTQNVVATPPGFRPDRPFRIVGAHLDTVPQAPGAEDNASGVAVMLELARMASTFGPEVPVVFVAFAAEEPRGPGDEDHHYGSRHLVEEMSSVQSDALVGMVSLDRVGVRSRAVPVCYGGVGSDDVREQLVRAADAADVRARRCENRTSDHWPFEKAGLPAARVGGVAYDAYHSSEDVAGVVSAAQLDRVGRVVWQWLRSPAP